MTTFQMKERMALTQLDEQISQLEREKQKIQMSSEEREFQIKKFDELIKQSESAVFKMVQNT